MKWSLFYDIKPFGVISYYPYEIIITNMNKIESEAAIQELLKVNVRANLKGQTIEFYDCRSDKFKSYRHILKRGLPNTATSKNTLILLKEQTMLKGIFTYSIIKGPVLCRERVVGLGQ